MKKGIDAPIVPILFSVIGVIGILIAWQSQNPYNFIFPAIMFILAILFIHTSLDGKYKIIHDVVKSLDIPNDSQVLDLGTGHGAVLLAVAKKLKQPGKAIGIDIWQSADQSGNSQTTTQQNIDRAQVSAVAKVQTADMTKLPFNDHAFDFVFASFAIHNVKPRKQRELAINEALRVLKTDGRLIIIDMEHTREFKRVITQSGWQVTVHHAGINGLWGGMPTSILITQK
ncbi:methyltransferase family protein [Limosilactobacillus mucosae]|uniref:class I SAM-dependent methyltransferase n=1 Tax=Limosilactobacillus mucosae TaxID=97478 RepID=UPI000D6DBF34|nr:methyltransferase domain-containing protein [Limosilactobacillus mucosae]MBN2900893.1 methyltransferase domain-containing protein [Limosilactobacillus mucosae]MDD6865499.1 methyltransferase domain-containing protein [Lactobacillus sp.]PWJ46245.1 methyltransferase family protein [Limosilactobacillus mucosae]SUQ20528.1 Methyltransferase domain-containing protein [Limosilactobacillus mucosae]